MCKTLTKTPNRDIIMLLNGILNIVKTLILLKLINKFNKKAIKFSKLKHKDKKN